MVSHPGESLQIRYEPRAVVWHSHRIDGEAFRRQMEQYMRGHVASLLVQFEKFHHFGNLRRLLVSLPTSLLAPRDRPRAWHCARDNLDLRFSAALGESCFICVSRKPHVCQPAFLENQSESDGNKP